MPRPLVLTLVLTLVLGSPPLRAQEPPAAVQAQRDSMEARVRARMGLMLRNQLGMTDEQVRRFQATNRRFEGQRRALFEQERRVRFELRAALAAGDSASPERVAALLDRTIALQRQRLDLLEAEQKELAGFLSPVQRARLFGLEEQLRRRMGELREQGPPAAGRRRPDGARPGAPRRPPGGR